MSYIPVLSCSQEPDHFIQQFGMFKLAENKYLSLSKYNSDVFKPHILRQKEGF